MTMPMPVKCTIVIAQKRPQRAADADDNTEPGEIKELVYNSELLRNLLSIAGISIRRARPLVDAILRHLSQEAHKDASQRLIELTKTTRHNGTISVELDWEDLMQVVARVVQARSFHPTLKLADSLVQRERGVIIMICGTSGTGKSTLASLLGQRLGITTIMSTDSIRNQLRGFISEEQDPVLHASSYETDNALLRMRPELSDEPQRRLIKKGYKAQCSTVLSQVMTLVNMWHSSCASVIVEGVHLHLKQVMQMMTQHPSILPFLVYIKKEAKHIERMSVRAQYLTTDPSRNKYVKNMRGIRQIQDYLLRSADKVAVPKVANSNVDMAVEIIHRTVMAALCRQSDPSQSMVDEDGRATALLEEFNTVYSQQCATQTQMKANQARIQSLVQSSCVMNSMSASDTVFEFDAPDDLHLQEDAEVPVFPPEFLAQTELFNASLYASVQSGGKIGPFLPDDAETECEEFAAGRDVPSTGVSAAGSVIDPRPGMQATEHQQFGAAFDSWGLWEQRLMPADAHSPHSSAGESLGAIGRFLWGDEDGQRALPASHKSSPRNSASLQQGDDDVDCAELSDGNGELTEAHGTANLSPSPTDDAVPSVCGTEQQLGLKDIVRARPRPEKDSSSESENSAADGDTHDDEYDEVGSNTARSAHVLVLGCNVSEKETGSLCDSTEVQIDDEETLSRLWMILLPNHGRWHDAQEPGRSALLLRALVAHLQHPSPSTVLRWPVRMRPAASAPAPLRSFNLSRLRLRSFASNNHRMHPPSEAYNIPHHEVRDLSITDGVPSVSQISSTTSHHSNETTSPHAIPTPSTPTGALTLTDPFLNPISPSLFAPLGPAGTNKNNPSLSANPRARADKNAPGASISPTASPPQPNSLYLSSQPIHATQKNKATTVTIASGAPAPLHSVLQQLSEDVDILLQGQESSQWDALRQLQTASSHLSVRMLRPVDSTHAVHQVPNRSSTALMHLAAVAEDVSPEERTVLDNETDNADCSRLLTPSQIFAGSTFNRSSMHAIAEGTGIGMYSVSGRDRQLVFSRTRRKVAGLTHPQHKGRFALQRSESFAGVQRGLAESKRHSGSLPNSPAAPNGSVLLHSERMLSNTLSEGQQHYFAVPSEWLMTPGELQLEVPVPPRLPSSPAKQTSVGGTLVIEGPPVQAFAETGAVDTSLEAAAACCGPEDEACEMLRRSRMWGESMLHHASGIAAAVQSKGTHRAAREGSGMIGEKMLQQACYCCSAVAGSAFESNTQPESLTMYSPLDVLGESVGEPLYRAVDCSRRGISCREMHSFRPHPCSDAKHHSDSTEGQGAPDGEQIDAGGASEGSTDVEEDSVPLVHALVVRVLHQFGINKAQHDTNASTAAPVLQ